jgi:hypothetical protein
MVSGSISIFVTKVKRKIQRAMFCIPKRFTNWNIQLRINPIKSMIHLKGPELQPKHVDVANTIELKLASSSNEVNYLIRFPAPYPLSW